MTNTSSEPPLSIQPPLFGDAHSNAQHRHMVDMLVCPATHAPLDYTPDRQGLLCRAIHCVFPIRQNIPILLVAEAQQID